MNIDSELKSIHNYAVKKLKTTLKADDSIKLAVYLATENKLYKDFVIYENNYNINIGLGILAKIDVRKNKIIFQSSNAEEIEVNEISEGLSNVLKNISAERWRAYGIVDFDYSKYIYLDKNVPRNKNLIEIVLPQLDININKNGISIRSQTKNEIDNIEKLIQKFKYSPEDNYISEVESEDLLKYRASEYKGVVSKAVNEINGRKYEKVILSRKIPLNNRVNMKESYLLGRERNTPARSYYIKIDDKEVIGFSPETVVEVDKDRNVYTFPLAGTRAMGSNLKETKKLKRELLTDTKEIAEHAVSVKLAFEELQNCCEEDSVRIIRFMDVLERGTVQHLASRLKGKLKAGMNEWNALYCLFPAVTATGIPKKESIKAISSMESDSRGLYSGGVFTLNNFGELDVALVLRSAFQNSEESWLRAGAGIVNLSKPKRELEETKEKLSSVLNQIVYEKN